MILDMIVAIAQNRVIGSDNKMKKPSNYCVMNREFL